jgi:flagellar protein FlgJ
MTQSISDLTPSATSTPPEADRIKAAAEQFEGFFIGQLLRQMRSNARELSGEEHRNDPGADMLDVADVALGNQLAGQHAFGIADAILKQLLPSGADSAAAGTAAATPAPARSEREIRAPEVKQQGIPVASK